MSVEDKKSYLREFFDSLTPTEMELLNKCSKENWKRGWNKPIDVNKLRSKHRANITQHIGGAPVLDDLFLNCKALEGVYRSGGVKVLLKAYEENPNNEVLINDVGRVLTFLHSINYKVKEDPYAEDREKAKQDKFIQPKRSRMSGRNEEDYSKEERAFIKKYRWKYEDVIDYNDLGEKVVTSVGKSEIPHLARLYDELKIRDKDDKITEERRL